MADNDNRSLSLSEDRTYSGVELAAIRLSRMLALGFHNYRKSARDLASRGGHTLSTWWIGAFAALLIALTIAKLGLTLITTKCPPARLGQGAFSVEAAYFAAV